MHKNRGSYYLSNQFVAEWHEIYFSLLIFPCMCGDSGFIVNYQATSQHNPVWEGGGTYYLKHKKPWELWFQFQQIVFADLYFSEMEGRIPELPRAVSFSIYDSPLECEQYKSHFTMWLSV